MNQEVITLTFMTKNHIREKVILQLSVIKECSINLKYSLETRKDNVNKLDTQK